MVLAATTICPKVILTRFLALWPDSQTKMPHENYQIRVALDTWYLSQFRWDFLFISKHFLLGKEIVQPISTYQGVPEKC